MNLGYARVSTDDQDTKLQTDALERAGCARIFREKVSGAKTDRPELARVIDTSREGDVIVVWKLDRLGRSLAHLMELIAVLEKKSVGFRSLTDNIDTTTASGRMFFHMMGALAQFERDLIRERTMAGLVAARAMGRFGGRRRKLTPSDLETARAALKAGDTMQQVAGRFRVAVATLYNAGIKKYPVPIPAPPKVRASRTKVARTKRPQPIARKPKRHA